MFLDAPCWCMCREKNKFFSILMQLQEYESLIESKSLFPISGTTVPCGTYDSFPTLYLISALKCVSLKIQPSFSLRWALKWCLISQYKVIEFSLCFWIRCLAERISLAFRSHDRNDSLSLFWLLAALWWAQHWPGCTDANDASPEWLILVLLWNEYLMLFSLC